MSNTATTKVPSIREFGLRLEATILSTIKHPMTRYDLAFMAREVHLAREQDGGEVASRFAAVMGRAVSMWIRSDDDNHDHAAMLAAWKEIAQ